MAIIGWTLLGLFTGLVAGFAAGALYVARYRYMAYVETDIGGGHWLKFDGKKWALIRTADEGTGTD